jgi:hypothetical protein
MLKNNFIKSNYLLSCDSINKYNLSCVYHVPKISNIVLEFPLKSIIKAFETKTTEDDSLIQIKAFLFLYLFFNNIPFINSNKLKVLKKSDKDNESFFALKIIISENQDINNLLISLFVENTHKFVIEDFKLLQDTSLYQIENKNKTLLNCKIPLSFFSGNESVLNTLTEFNDKDFILNLTFHIKKNFTVHDTKKFIKNNKLFWING